MNRMTRDVFTAGIVGDSAWRQRMLEAVELVAQTDSTVLLTGPTGTGKELFARAIHAASPRAAAPFIPVDCAATTTELFAGHLFGHVRGAYTGANHDSLGCFRAAEGGTIFLDEIGELGLDLQKTLLRVLQQRTVTPIGSQEFYPVNVRVIVATNRELRDAVAAATFRQDLFYRLNVITLRTTPLAERPEDIPPLVRHFLAKISVQRGLPTRTMSAAALHWLQAQAWPGNVRQLENLVERALIFARCPVIDDELLARLHDDVPKDQPVTAQQKPLPAANTWPSLAEIEREHIRRTWEQAGFNQTRAAELLQIDRTVLRRKLKSLGLIGGSAMIPRARRPR